MIVILSDDKRYDRRTVTVFSIFNFHVEIQKGAVSVESRKLWISDPGSCPKCDVISIIAIVNILIVFLFI